MKDFKFYVFIASILLVIYLVAEYNRPRVIDWTPTLSNNDKIPYGTYILYHQLHDIFPGADIQSFREPVYNVINDHGIQHSTYLIICNEINLNEYDYDKLTQFIKKGNDVLISASSFGQYFTKKLKVETNNENSFNRKESELTFSNKTLDTSVVYSIDKNLGDGYFSSFDTAKAVVLGQNSLHHSNFIKYPFGNNALYLNTNPLLFTNYSLLNQQGATYSSIALSFLKNDKSLIWDEYYTSGREGDESLMRVFLRSHALRGAYYIALFSLLIFVLYEMKRRQRIIPVIAPLNNTTVDFVNVVGQVYYEQRNNSNIAHKKVLYFLEHLRTTYHLKTTVLNDEFVTALSHKSGVPATLIQQLLNQVALVRSDQHISDSELILLNKNIEQFYLQSR